MYPTLQISIHAPLAGSDSHRCSRLSSRRYFNPRSPRGERRPRASLPPGLVAFQSTLPSRGATIGFIEWLSFRSYFNPRSPRGERRIVRCRSARVFVFQSTLPSRGATLRHDRPSDGCAISIHAPLAGSDINLA